MTLTAKFYVSHLSIPEADDYSRIISIDEQSSIFELKEKIQKVYRPIFEELGLDLVKLKPENQTIQYFPNKCSFIFLPKSITKVSEIPRFYEERQIFVLYPKDLFG